MLMTQSDVAQALGINIKDIPQVSKDTPMRKASLVQIQARVARRFNLTLHEIVGDQRSRRVSWPRMIGYWLSAKLTNASLPQIGVIYNKDHSTVMHGIKVVEEWQHHPQRTQWHNAARLLLKEFSHE